jgi:uncharacterized membrane protein YdjX (TVP38/TMEM64 family)
MRGMRSGAATRRTVLRPVNWRHKPVRVPRPAAPLVYIPEMSGASPPVPHGFRLVRRAVLLLVLVAATAAIYYANSRESLLEALVRHRELIDAFVTNHAVEAVLAYIGLYIFTVALSVPGATFLTVTSGFLFGVWVGAAASVVGATLGATAIFLIARTAFGEPLLACAGERGRELARGFRADAFSYLLFLRLIPAFPFFLVNLVPAFAGVRLVPFVAATILGVIPASVVFALAGTGLDSILANRQRVYEDCLARGGGECSLRFNAHDVVTPEFMAALAGLALLALLPVAIKYLRAWRRV